jgi:phage terminase large subunit
MQIETARVFAPLLKPSRYKGAWGGRGSGKSHYMAGSVVEHCLLNPGSRIVCIREVQKTLAQSAKLLIENKIQEFGVGSEFRVLYDRIDTPGGGLIIQGMQDQNAESIKSLEAYNIAWCEEAQTLSNRSLALLRPTIRVEGSEIWFSWNPRMGRNGGRYGTKAQSAPPTRAAVLSENSIRTGIRVMRQNHRIIERCLRSCRRRRPVQVAGASLRPRICFSAIS